MRAFSWKLVTVVAIAFVVARIRDDAVRKHKLGECIATYADPSHNREGDAARVAALCTELVDPRGTSANASAQ